MNGLLLSSAPLQVFLVLSIPHRSCTQSLTPLGLSRLLVQMRPLECRLRYESHFTWWWSSASTMVAGLRRGGGHHGSSQWSRCCRSTQRGKPPQPQPQQVQQQPAWTPAQRAQNSGSVKQQLTTGGVENRCSQKAKTIWQNWLREGRRAVSGQDCKVTWQRCWRPAEAKGGQGAQPILGDKFAEVEGKKSRRASRELHSTLARCTGSGSARMVRSGRVWTRLHASCSSRALERMFKVQRQRMCPKVAEDVSHCKIANLQREEMWKTLTTELGRHTDSRSVANVCADDLLQGGSTKKKNINRPSRAKVISYSTNTIGQALGASSDTPRLMDSSDVARSGDEGCEVRRRCRRSAEE